jgi:hypothetical protein
MSALPNRDRRAERREATRREILDTAWQIARQEGLSAVTLREVAGLIGMRSPMTVQASEPRAPVLPRDVAMRLAAAEYERFADMLRTLRLTGPAGGTWARGEGGPVIETDAVEFCRVLSGRGHADGLLAVQVPF